MIHPLPLFLGEETLSLVAAIAVYGLITSLTYALFAEGFSLIFGVARIVDVTYGAWYTLAAYSMFALVSRLGVTALPSVLITVVLVVSVAVGFYFVAFRKSEAQLQMLVIAFFMALIVQNLLTFLFTNFPWATPTFFAGSISIAGISVFNQLVAAAVVSGIMLLTLWFLIYRTKLGIGIRAVAQDRTAALLVGIRPESVTALSMIISTLLVAVASLLVTPQSTITPTMGWQVITFAFAIVVLGGMGDFRGALVASFVIGYVEKAVEILGSPLYGGAASLAAVLVALWLRPRGIFGKSLEE